MVAHALDSACRLCETIDYGNAEAGGPNPFHAVCCVFDMAGLRVGDLDLCVLRALFDTLQSQYPNILSRLFFVDAPFFFRGTWRCLSPFIKPETKAKITFASGSAGKETLRQELGYNILPTELTGSSGSSGPSEFLECQLNVSQAGQTASDASLANSWSNRWFDQTFIIAGLLVLGLLARIARTTLRRASRMRASLFDAA